MTSNTSYNLDTLRSLPTTSAKIRYLDSFGLTRSDIVKVFKSALDKEIRYQHVRNVLLQPLKKAASPVTKMVEGDL